MKNIIQINKENSTKYLFIDNISSIVITEPKKSTRYEWFDEEIRYYLFGIFKSVVKEGVYDVVYKDSIANDHAYIYDLHEYDLFLREKTVFYNAKITFNLNNGHSHTLTYNDDKITEFDSLVEEIKKLTNVVIQVK
jgi:hypothetical protein